MSEQTESAHIPGDVHVTVPGPRGEDLELPPASMPTADEGDLTDGMEEAWWLLHQGASAEASVWEILARLPQAVRQVGRLAWKASPRATVALAVLQLAAAAMLAFGLMASVAVAQQIFAEGPTPERVRAAVPQLVVVVVLLTLRALLEYGVSMSQGLLTPRIRTALEREFLYLTSHVHLEAADDPDWHDEAYRARNQGLFYARQITGQVVSLAAATLGLVGAAGVITVLHPGLILLLPLSVIPVGAAAVKSARARYHSFKRFNSVQRRTEVFSWLLLDRDAAAELRSHTAQQALLAEHHHLSGRIAEEDTRLNRAAARLSLIGRGTGGVGGGITYIALGLMLIHGWLPLAAGAGAVLAIQSSHATMIRVVDVAHLLYEHAMWVNDLLAFQERCRRQLPRRTGLPAPLAVQEITLQDVVYAYPGKKDQAKPALNGVSMTLHAGQTVAFVGVNGSGKSTCARLLAGLYDPTSGSIRWDGHSVLDLDTESLQARVATVLQDPVRLPFTALANITISRGTLTEADPEQVLAAARASGADQVIAGLPGQWHAVLSKRFKDGQELSAGQWAKMAVARGLYKDAQVLLLDEPTASMDPRAEHAVYQAVLRGEHRADRITVLISHRLASVVDCDHIYVFDDGRIIESGSHQELMDRGGEYAEMFSLQAAGYLGAPASAKTEVQ
ncbi:ABC transporter ATP-binding protein [Streptomyces sp. NPDC048638]|uniref:ABC transporter ATP-binding protein n=1 Tax=Streptomyces sp. NPDC048638 TaxID=3365580 RepID=UPI00371B620B